MQSLTKDKWYQKWWRPSCAVVYLIICIIDFGIMPVLYEVSNKEPQEVILMALQFEEPATQIAIINTFSETSSWSPITLLGSGLFHLAFGAIIAGAAITRGWEKKQRIATFGGYGYGGGAVIDQQETMYEISRPRKVSKRHINDPDDLGIPDDI